jgi:hypothetical protein
MLTFFNAANAKTFRQSTGEGNFSMDLAYENYEIKNNLTKSTVVGVDTTWNETYEAPEKRDVLMLKGVYGLFEKLDVFAGIGFAYDKWTADDKNTGEETLKQTGQNSIYELGLKGTAFEFENNNLYIAYLLKYSYLDSGEKYSASSISKSSSVWNEYYADLEMGYYIDEYKLTPYFGVSYLDLKVKQKLDDDYNKYENDKDYSLFLGVNKEIKNNISLNIEGSIGAKEGINLGASYNF